MRLGDTFIGWVFSFEICQVLDQLIRLPAVFILVGISVVSRILCYKCTPQEEQMTGALSKGLELLLFLKGHTYCILRNNETGTLVCFHCSVLNVKSRLKERKKQTPDSILTGSSGQPDS